MTTNLKLSRLYGSLESRVDRHRKLIVFCVSAVCGASFGLLRSDWQVAVEPAQVIAGLVQYPPNNPFYVYQVKTWTILHQIAAAGLHLGFTEGMLSVVYSVLAGALAFAGIALWALAFSKNIPLAVLIPFSVFVITPEWGINYPLILLGQSHTYGIIGLSFIFLTTALFGVGEFEWGALMLGLSPAIHASLGVWCVLIILICVAWDFRAFRPHLPGMLRFGLAGGLVTLISLVFHFLVTYHVPEIDPALANRYLSTFIRSWDAHRGALNLLTLQTLLTVMTGVISLTGLQLLRPTLPGHSHFLLRSLLISMALGMGLSLIDQFGFRLPDAVLVFMPARLLNFNNLAYLPLLLGLMWHYRDRVWVQANLLVVLPATYFLASMSDDLTRLFILSGAALVSSLGGGQAPLSLLLAYVSFALVFQPAELLPPSALMLCLSFLVFGSVVWILQTQAYVRLLLNVLLIAILGMNAVVAFKQVYGSRYNAQFLWNSKPILAEIPKDDGLLLTGTDLHPIQLFSRRPILLDTQALDMLPYAPEGGPEFERILRDAYGVDFFSSPGRTTLGIEPTKTLWESWTPADWRKIQTEFNVNLIMTTPEWKLQLPELPQTSGYILYQIPRN